MMAFRVWSVRSLGPFVLEQRDDIVTLKKLVRDAVVPDRNLGHADRARGD